MMQTEQLVKCPDCGGDGKNYHLSSDAWGYDERCRECKGTGYVMPEKAAEIRRWLYGVEEARNA